MSIKMTIGLTAAVMLPLWNIPLIVNIEKRRSSRDISLAWTLGVLACLWGMLPSALDSSDLIFKVFSIANVIAFSGVAVQVLRYRSAP